MLSRVANCLYWMARYIERAENVARIVDVNTQLMLDFRSLDHERIERHWMPILQSTYDEEAFFKLYDEADGHTVPEFLVFRRENSNSIASSVALARENARMVRDQITIEMWEEINRLHLFLSSGRAREVWEASSSDFLQEIRSSSLQFQGLVDATVVHNEGWDFMQAGKFLERADKTTRILDVRYESLPARGAPAPVSQIESVEWSAVLRSCSAWDAYRHLHGADVGPRRVANLLLLSPDFPRSVRFCLAQFDKSLRRISGVSPGRFSNEAEKLSGRLLADLFFSTVEEIFEHGLHDYLDLIQTRFNDIGTALFAAYIFQSFDNVMPDDQQQQQQQQQQQGTMKRCLPRAAANAPGGVDDTAAPASVAAGGQRGVPAR